MDMVINVFAGLSAGEVAEPAGTCGSKEGNNWTI